MPEKPSAQNEHNLQTNNDLTFYNSSTFSRFLYYYPWEVQEKRIVISHCAYFLKLQASFEGILSLKSRLLSF